MSGELAKCQIAGKKLALVCKLNCQLFDNFFLGIAKFTLLQNSIKKKSCSIELYIHQTILKKRLLE